MREVPLYCVWMGATPEKVGGMLKALHYEHVAVVGDYSPGTKSMSLKYEPASEPLHILDRS